MKTITLILVLAFSWAGPLQAGRLESMRKSSEDIRINTDSLRQNAATAQYEIQPTPANGLADLIIRILRLIFNPNGDIEIETPPEAAPQVDGVLEDDQEEETYVEGQAYEPVNTADLPQEPLRPREEPRADAVTGQGGSIPADLKQKALDYFNANSARIENKRYLGIVDFSAHSSRQRFWILDMQTGAERAMRVAHGTGSDPDGDGYATRFSNQPNSRASSLGFYLTGALYTGKHGRSMRLHGLSSTNSNALSRAVVVHDSNYVREANVRQGRSFGCLAVANSEIAAVLASLRGGALIYAGLSGADF
ncbi:MAG: murein L,D-transpeptidase catalytic domain family protein [Elusimicrobiales bacterium]|nr:murein L,D-transpeptidase catalytic domain family protein [Elusimicrobiales bacterium]